MTTRAHTLATLAAMGLALTGAITGGCRGDRSDKPPRQFFPDMDDSPKWKPQTQTEFYVDQRSMRQPVAATVPFGESTLSGDPGRERYMEEDVPFLTGKASLAADAKEIQWIPASVKVTPALLARGKERFDIYCSACHGYTGHGGMGPTGEGLVGKSFQVAPANFMDPKYSDRAGANGADGHIYWVIMNGWPADKPNMPSYKHAVKPEDAWAIVAHIRALQAANGGRIEDVPEAQRPDLVRTKPAKSPEPSPGATPPAPTPPAAPKGAGEGKP